MLLLIDLLGVLNLGNQYVELRLYELWDVIENIHIFLIHLIIWLTVTRYLTALNYKYMYTSIYVCLPVHSC